MYMKGDATNPKGEGNKIIIHVCNNIGKWGAGFVLAISKKWKKPEKIYRDTKKYILGDIQIVQVKEDIYVINMIAQKGIRILNNKIPLDYFALNECLKKVNKFAIEKNATIHMPKIGAGLAGGDWKIIESIINYNIKVPYIIYEL